MCSAGMAQTQSLSSIKLAAEQHVSQYAYQSPYPPGVTLNRLDKRLRLKRCESPLDVKFSNPGKVMGNTSLKIQCPKPVKWHIYLPVRISLFQDVLVAAKPLVRAQSLDGRDIRYAKKEVSATNSGYFTELADLEHLITKRNIQRGEMLSHNNLKPVLMVKSGQKVTILLSYKGLNIKSSGIALQSAVKGQIVRVRNSQSKKIVEGIVSDLGQITVSL